ncbi:prephenate dehydratase [Capilliphycus salinus ALCB114379]|uniref:prephenate dehydratase n=1 Tax=Capilliphycus salinus TaxID=2768948 RepID=UPI0039A422EA
MQLSIAHLGPSGTYAEAAATAYVRHLVETKGLQSSLYPYPSIAQTLWAVAKGEVDLGVVPVENSIEGSVSMTLDTLWQIDSLRIQQALVLPISHALISLAENQQNIEVVYSHPQALAQCQEWLNQNLPQVRQIATNSTTEALQHLDRERSAGAIASERAASLYKLPIMAHPINDYPDNCTRFWAVSLQPSPGGSHTSLAFSVPENKPGVLVQPLQVFAKRGINMSRIESRPTKRLLGDYLFFIDLEANTSDQSVQSALAELATYTKTLKIFGSYSIVDR